MGLFDRDNPGLLHEPPREDAARKGLLKYAPRNASRAGLAAFVRAKGDASGGAHPAHNRMTRLLAGFGTAQRVVASGASCCFDKWIAEFSASEAELHALAPPAAAALRRELGSFPHVAEAAELGASSPWLAPTTDADRDKAVALLTSPLMVAVGTTERLKDSLAVVAKRLGWKRALPPKLATNMQKRRYKALGGYEALVSPALEAEIEKLNAHDLAVWEAASRWGTKKVSPRG